jgi:hypothetical protein
MNSFAKYDNFTPDFGNGIELAFVAFDTRGDIIVAVAIVGKESTPLLEELRGEFSGVSLEQQVPMVIR